MAKSIRANLELVSDSKIKAICNLDARQVSTNPGKYVQENLLSYYVAINTWLMIVKQWSEYGWMSLLHFIESYGLFRAIKEFDACSTEVITGSDVSFSLARVIYDDVRSKCPIVGIPTLNERTVHREPMSAMLLICRYLKRFSPLYADKLRDASIKDFQSRQAYLKHLQHQPDSEYINSRVRASISEILDWDRAILKIDSVNLTDIVFTPGVSFDTTADLVSKLKYVAANRVEYFPIPFGIPLVSHSKSEVPQYWGYNSDREVHCVRLIAVPKNYKTARVIAPENVIRQAYARAWFDVLDGLLPPMIRLHDQSVNQELARQGSISGNLATLDLHAASDSITWTHLYNLFPNEFVGRLVRVLPTHYEVGGHRFFLQSAATMGNSITFWLESVLFAGIALAATREYNAFSGDSETTVSVYGDDIIVPTNAAVTVIDWLERLGFTVNEDKSFFTRELLYRESCGEEYINGVNCSSVYFPRFPLQGTLGGAFSDRVIRDGFTGVCVDTMSAVLDLQHKMFNLCVPAAHLLTELCKEADPKLTTSTPDMGLSDIWDYYDRPVVGYGPYYRLENGKMVRIKEPSYERERHSTPITVSTSKAEIPAQEELLVNLYNYQQFLKYGPRYDTPLDRLLGVSSPPISIGEASGRISVKWVLIG